VRKSELPGRKGLEEGWDIKLELLEEQEEYKELVMYDMEEKKMDTQTSCGVHR